MAYNLYQVQMAKAWAERIEKENKQAEAFWHTQSLKGSGSVPSSPAARPSPPSVHVDNYFGGGTDTRSHAGSAPGAAKSAAPTGFTSKTSYLRSKMEKLEAELEAERQSRRKVEEDLKDLRESMRR